MKASIKSLLLLLEQGQQQSKSISANHKEKDKERYFKEGEDKSNKKTKLH